MHYRRVSVRLPARICAFASVFAPASLPSESSMLTTCLYRCRSENGSGSEFLRYCRHGHHTDVQGGFDHTFCHVGVRITPFGVAFSRRIKVSRDVALMQLCRSLRSPAAMPDSSLFCQFVFQDLLIGIHQRFQGVTLSAATAMVAKASRGMALRMCRR